MNVEMQLISRIIRTGNISEVLEWGITTDDFKTDFGKGAFAHLYNFYTHPGSRGAVMGVQSFKTHMPSFTECDDPGMTTAALCMMVRRNRLILEARESAEAMMQEVETNDPDAVIAKHMRQMQTLVELGAQGNRDVRFSEAMPRLLSQYEAAKNGRAMYPIVYPWPALNEETLGIAPDDYIVFYGRPKSMKSWVLAYLIAHLYDQTLAGEKLRILVYTKEMGPDNIFKRISACIAGVDYRELRTGRLSAQDEAAFRDVYEQSQKRDNRDRLICLRGSLSGSPDGTGSDTVAWFRSKVEKYRPNIACIDGAYLLNTPKSYSKDNMRVQAISRELRMVALDMNIPIVITFQATRSAAKHNAAELDEIAFSDAIGQDATAAFRVINEKTKRMVDGREVNTLLLGVAGSREWSLDGIRIVGEPARDFSFVELVSTAEMIKAKQSDSEDRLAKPSRSPSNKNSIGSTVGALHKRLIDQQVSTTILGVKPKRAPKTKHE
jgi:replicative DNA helicase